MIVYRRHRESVEIVEDESEDYMAQYMKEYEKQKEIETPGREAHKEKSVKVITSSYESRSTFSDKENLKSRSGALIKDDQPDVDANIGSVGNVLTENE